MLGIWTLYTISEEILVPVESDFNRHGHIGIFGSHPLDVNRIKVMKI